MEENNEIRNGRRKLEKNSRKSIKNNGNKNGNKKRNVKTKNIIIIVAVIIVLVILAILIPKKANDSKKENTPSDTQKGSLEKVENEKSNSNDQNENVENPKEENNQENAQGIFTVKDISNIRREMDTESEIVATVQPGVEIQRTEISGEWSKVSYGEYEGYILTELLTDIQ